MALPSKIRQLIDEVGEEQAKALLRRYFAEPKNIPQFSLLFPNHIQSDPASFHIELYQDMAELHGLMGAAAPRGFSKSTITDLVFAAWVALNAKRHFIILISDTVTQAVGLLDALKDELENNEAIHWLYGDIFGAEWNTEGLIIKGIDGGGRRHQTKIIAKGAGMKIRGLKFRSYRPDLVIIDDLENDELVESSDRRKKLKNWLIKGVLPALAKGIGCIIMIGTVLHRDSLLNNILKGKDQFAGWKRRRYQGILPDGNSLWPERWPVEELISMRSDPKHPLYLGPIAFASEIQNEPISEEDQIIKEPWLEKKYRLQEQLSTYKQANPDIEDDQLMRSWMQHTFRLVIGHVDPAISEKEKADFWAMSTVGVTKACPICDGNPAGHIMQLDMLEHKESDLSIQVGHIIDQYQQWRHDKIKVETVAFQAGLYTLARKNGAERGIYPPLHAWRPDRDKTRRAIVASATFAGMMVHLREDHPLATKLHDQILEFPQGEHDDMFDALLGSMEEGTLKRKVRAFSNKPSGF